MALKNDVFSQGRHSVCLFSFLCEPWPGLASMIIFEIMAGLQLIKAYIERSEVNTQEKLLEIEYQIAALTEKLESMESGD